MTGLEKIINRINADTEKECSSIAAAAEKTAEGIIEKAKAAGHIKANVRSALSGGQLQLSGNLWARRILFTAKMRKSL